MPPTDPIAEFRAYWLPHVTNEALCTLITLLEQDSPLLIRRTFCIVKPRGCLASHIAWSHPRTRQLDEEAGIVWLTRVAGLNPATSLMIQAWDDESQQSQDLRLTLLRICQEEWHQRLGNAGQSALDLET